LSGQAKWLEYSQDIQERSLQACSLEIKSAKELRTQILKALTQANDQGLLDTKLSEIYKILRMTPGDRQQVVIVGGLEKSGTKNFDRSREVPHFARKDGCWFDFSILIQEDKASAEIIGFDFEMRFPHPIPVRFVRFDLNLPRHDNQADGLRFHLHPGCDDFMVHSPPISPLEILHLFLYGFEIPQKLRQ
jgi:hypothetical protein